MMKNVNKGFYFGLGFWLAGLAVTVIPFIMVCAVVRAVLVKML